MEGFLFSDTPLNQDEMGKEEDIEDLYIKSFNGNGKHDSFSAFLFLLILSQVTPCLENHFTLAYFWPWKSEVRVRLHCIEKSFRKDLKIFVDKFAMTL